MCAERERERVESREQSAEGGVRRAQSAVRSAHREEHRAQCKELLSVCAATCVEVSAVCVVARVRARWRAHPFRFNESVLPLADCASCWESCFCELLSSADELCRAPVSGINMLLAATRLTVAGRVG